MEEAENEIKERKKSEEKEELIDNANARFIILDPNGEYSKTFADFKPIIFKVETYHEG